MITANELRIGNWVKTISTQKIFRVSIKTLSSLRSGICYIEPIPITEEWLLRFGFEKTSLHYFKKDSVILSFEDYFYECFLGNKLVIINHIHQLQNLYFALTGKELELK
jgi:hypothetical protein